MHLNISEKKFVDLVETEFQKRKFLTKREVSAGFGVADLVLGEVNQDKLKIRKNNKQKESLLSELYFNILQVLPDVDENKDPLSLEELQDKIPVSSSYLKYNLLRHLVNAGYVKEFSGKAYLKVNGWLPLMKKIIAIEAKLYDWKKGFHQAVRYRDFADKTYLCVPKDFAHRVDRELLKKHNVGFFSYDIDKGILKEEVRTKSIKPLYDAKRSYASEFFFDSLR